MFTTTTINQRKLGCWALLGLSGDQRISTISYAVLTQYLIVTDGRHTDGLIVTGTFRQQLPRSCISAGGKNCTETVSRQKSDSTVQMIGQKQLIIQCVTKQNNDITECVTTN